MKRMTEQVMGMVQEQSAKGAQALRAQEEQQANLAQYDQQARAAIDQVSQVGTAIAQGFQQLAAQNQQVLQALAVTLERMNAAPVIQNADVLTATLGQVSDGFQQVIDAVQAPKEVEFVPDKNGVPKGARLKPTKSAQGAANNVASASTTVAAVQQMEARQQAQMAQIVASLESGLQAVIEAVKAPKSVKLERGPDGRVSGATARVQ